MMETFIKMCSQVGFPVAVCVFLLLERSKTTKELIKAIQELSLMINKKLNL